MGWRRSSALAMVWFCQPAWAVVIDRVAVSVGNSVITETADRLVDQLLVRNELQVSRYPAPPPTAWERLVAGLKRDLFHGSDAEMQAAREKYGLTADELKSQLQWQVTFLRFVNLRFRPAVQITDAEIQNYFEHTVRPAEEKAHPGAKVALEDYQERIERALMQQRVDQQLNAWLKEARARSNIQFREEAFQ